MSFRTPNLRNYCDPPNHCIPLPIATLRKGFTIEHEGIHFLVCEVHELSDKSGFRIDAFDAYGYESLEVRAGRFVHVCQFRNVSFHLMDYGTMTAYNISRGDGAVQADYAVPAPLIQIDGVMMLETKDGREDVKLRLTEGDKGEELKQCVELARSCYGEAGRPFHPPYVDTMYEIVLIPELEICLDYDRSNVSVRSISMRKDYV